MLKCRRGRALVVPVLALAITGVSGCSKAGDVAGGGGLSLVDKAKTVQICVDVAGSLTSAAAVGAKVAQGSITQADAAAQLQPIAASVTTLAGQNASLPIGKGLQQLSDSIIGLQKVSSSAPSDVQAAAASLASATKGVLASCADIGK